ncbi:CrcB-like protein-domain-containing protein [Ilyonectria destructans]|nr:CrcB-like protein-domain-containing protein [Ilyonectria destructans]
MSRPHQSATIPASQPQEKTCIRTPSDPGPISNSSTVSRRRDRAYTDDGIQQPRISTEFAKAQQRRQRYSTIDAESDIPESWVNLDEIAASLPVENLQEPPVYHRTSLEQVRSREREYLEEQARESRQLGEVLSSGESSTAKEPTRWATQLYVHSYLVFFSLLGALARKGLESVTTYPGTPITFDTIWVNFAGCLIMGILMEDRMLFLYEWGSPIYDQQIIMEERRQKDEESGTSSEREPIDLAAAKRTFMSTKKSIPLFIGLTTGFCGSFTTFSDFIMDSFLALSNGLEPPSTTLATDRNGGYDFMALLGVGIATVSLSLAGLMVGAHLAVALEGTMPSLPYTFMRKFLDRLVVFLGWGSWVGAILLCVFPPHDLWRGRIMFSLVFAPLGVFTRFYLALFLNGRSASFPVGTFAANVLASMIIALAWDVNHAAVGGIIGCQVLQGIQGGFCGCLSTVSTWVVELSSLGRKHAYLYGFASVLVSFALVVIIAGSEKWSQGVHDPLCSS